jgi:hypothetical protein
VHNIIPMSKYFLFLLLFSLSVKSYSANIILFGEPKANEVFYSLPGTEMRLSLADYINLRPSDFKKITGHKLTLKETIVFKITQKRIKKTIRKDGTIDMLAFTKQSKEPFKWNWGGFFLGLFLPVVGTIITLFFKDKNRKHRIICSIIGLSTIASIMLAVAVISAANYY